MSGTFFDAIKAGKIPTPECAKTLGIEILSHDPVNHSVELEFEGRPEFGNPIGHVQGGFLAAMLDDAMGLAAATATALIRKA
ncbi:MAG: PaaI family thioesterase [Afipia sp.]|nr:PaaI family thioesterase [Afipia sp.]